MDFASILLTLSQVVKVAELAIQVGQDAGPHIMALAKLFRGEDLSPEERSYYRTEETRLRAILQEPV